MTAKLWVGKVFYLDGYTDVRRRSLPNSRYKLPLRPSYGSLMALNLSQRLNFLAPNSRRQIFRHPIFHQPNLQSVAIAQFLAAFPKTFLLLFHLNQPTKNLIATLQIFTVQFLAAQLLPPNCYHPISAV